MSFNGNSNRPFGGFGTDDLNDAGGFMLDSNESSIPAGMDKRQNIGTEQKLAPLKVGMILRSYSNFVTLSRFQLFDKDINLFKLVGFVRSVEHDEYPQRLRFYLDDGSGLILVDWLVDNTGTKYKQELVGSINEGCFVKVFGELTLMVSEPSVRAFAVRPLVCTDEISLHDIDVASFIVRSTFAATPTESCSLKVSNSIGINKIHEENFVSSGNYSVKESNQNTISSMFNLSGQFGGGGMGGGAGTGMGGGAGTGTGTVGFNNTSSTASISNRVSSNKPVINGSIGQFNSMQGGFGGVEDQNVPMNSRSSAKLVSAVAARPVGFGTGGDVGNPLRLREIISSILEQASATGSPEMTIDGILDSLITRDVQATQEEIRAQLKSLVGEAKVYQTNPNAWRATGY